MGPFKFFFVCSEATKIFVRYGQNAECLRVKTLVYKQLLGLRFKIHVTKQN